MYDPHPGRFISRDPAREDGIDLLDENPYAYARNNPVNLTDPSGLQPEEKKKYRMSPGDQAKFNTFPEWFRRLDSDGDGQVALHEWPRDWSDESFKEIDYNDDGFITIPEMERWLKKQGRGAQPAAREQTRPAAASPDAVSREPVRMEPVPGADMTGRERYEKYGYWRDPQPSYRLGLSFGLNSLRHSIRTRDLSGGIPPSFTYQDVNPDVVEDIGLLLDAMKNVEPNDIETQKLFLDWMKAVSADIWDVQMGYRLLTAPERAEQEHQRRIKAYEAMDDRARSRQFWIGVGDELLDILQIGYHLGSAVWNYEETASGLAHALTNPGDVFDYLVRAYEENPAYFTGRAATILSPDAFSKVSKLAKATRLAKAGEVAEAARALSKFTKLSEAEKAAELGRLGRLIEKIGASPETAMRAKQAAQIAGRVTLLAGRQLLEHLTAVGKKLRIIYLAGKYFLAEVAAGVRNIALDPKSTTLYANPVFRIIGEIPEWLAKAIQRAAQTENKALLPAEIARLRTELGATDEAIAEIANKLRTGDLVPANPTVRMVRTGTPHIIRYPISQAKTPPLVGTRQTGIDRAWKLEVELIEKTGKGTAPWAESEIRQILAGKSYKDLGYTGHHINKVADYPAWQGDPRNFAFLKQGSGESHMTVGHPGGTTARQPTGDLIDRQAMLDTLK